MNKVILMGRLTRDPDFRAGETPFARYSLAVDRYGKDNGADFIPCVAFGKRAEFANNYLRKGTKVVVVGRLQTGSYKNKEGVNIHTTDVIVDEQEFAESKQATTESTAPTPDEGWVNVPDQIDEELPFH